MSTEPMIAFTFDDGPNLTTTVRTLDVLEKYGVVASFFLIGNFITPETEPVIRRQVEMGCEICNHSKTHSFMNEMSAEDIKAEIAYVQEEIKRITGKTAAFFRPPYIAVNQTMYDSIEMPFICGKGCNDWEPDKSAQFRIDRMMEMVEDGTIFLLHDMAGNENTVEAIDYVIPKFLEQGYKFVTLTELFTAKGADMKHNNNMNHSLVK